MIRKGRLSVSPKRILTSLKSSSLAPASPLKSPLTHIFPTSNPFFSTRASQDRHRTLVKLYGHFDLEKQLFPHDTRNIITIPNVKTEKNTTKTPTKRLLIRRESHGISTHVRTNSTPKRDLPSNPKVCYVNLSEYVHTTEKCDAVKSPPQPKKVLTQGNKSHINRAEKRQVESWLVAGKSAFGESSGRLNRTVPNIRLSDTDDYKDIPKRCFQARKIKSASRTRSRAESGGKPPDKVVISPPQITLETEGVTATAGCHDRTTSISIDLNLPTPITKPTRVFQLNKVDLGQMLDVPSPKSLEIQRRRPASAKIASKRPFWRLDDSIC